MQDFYINRQWLKRIYLICLILVACLVALLWQQVQSPPNLSKLANSEQVEVSRVNEPIQPIPLYINLDERKVKLGEKLFHDTRLSKDNRFSCASCHNLNTGGVDRRVSTIGINGKGLGINTPTVFNSGFNFKQHWDGKFNDLAEHVLGTIPNSEIMGSNWAEVITRLQKSPDLSAAFAQVYSNGISKDNIVDAIAIFEQSLYTPNSRFDRFLRGDTQALTKEQKQGYSIFKEYGCVSCHQGVNVGGNMFQQFGIMGDYFADRGNISRSDLGRFNVTGKESDRYTFKVPSLRNITLTLPYFHDGSAKSLKEAVAVMAKYQLGRPLSAEQVDLIIQFLTTLTGEYQGKPL